MSAHDIFRNRDLVGRQPGFIERRGMDVALLFYEKRRDCGPAA